MTTGEPLTRSLSERCANTTSATTPFMANAAQHLGAPATPPPLPYGKTMCRAATASLAFGIGALVGILIPLVLPLAIPAIIQGHRALRQIKLSGGALMGRRRAIVGLSAGYTATLAGIFVIGFLVHVGTALYKVTRENSSKQLSSEPGYAAAQAAEKFVYGGNSSQVGGNTPEAKELASIISDILVQMQQDSLSAFGWTAYTLKNRPSVYCHLEEGRCAILVFPRMKGRWVPGARGHFEELVWVSAHQGAVESQVLPSGASLACAIWAGFNYSVMHFGKLDPHLQPDVTPAHESPSPITLESIRRFYSFFAPRPGEIAVPP